MVIFGGSSDTGEANNQVHTLDLTDLAKGKTQWIATTQDSGPSPRYGMSGFYYKRHIYIFGGYNKKIEKVFSDLWMLDVTKYQWSKVHLRGTHECNSTDWCTQARAS
jgi:N-acetylneuraminic acid mutarotase